MKRYILIRVAEAALIGGVSLVGGYFLAKLCQ